MLDQFKGEIFHHPAALEYSGNTCSHSCAYCFANTRSSERRFSVAALAKLCLGRSRSDSLSAWLFNHGHAVCVSNRSDPFCRSNRDNTPAVFELLDLVENGVYIQTKGVSDTRNWDVLDRFRKRNVVVYITISGVRDAVLKRVEPGAPLYSERVRLAKYCKARGWNVVIGLNPCFEPWLGESEIDEVVDELNGVGIDEYFIEPLWLNRATYELYPASRRERMPEREVGGVFDHHSDGVFYAFRQTARLYKRGLRVYTQGLPKRTEYGLDGYRLLGKTMNPVYTFVNWAYETNAATGKNVFTFTDFLKVMLKGNEEFVEYRNRDFYKYIMCVNRGVWKRDSLARTAKSLEDVYRVCWNNLSIHNSPQKLPCFYTVGHDGKPTLDDNGDVEIKFLGETGIGSNRMQYAPADELGGKEVR